MTVRCSPRRMCRARWGRDRRWHSRPRILLLHERLDALPVAIRTARKTLRVMQQNLAWSLGYNLAAVPLAAFGSSRRGWRRSECRCRHSESVLNARRLAVQVPES